MVKQKICGTGSSLYKIRKLTNILIRNRERSAQEAAYVICGLDLRGATGSTIFVNTKPAGDRTRVVRKECLLNEEYAEDDFCSDIYDKYTKRPYSLQSIP